MSSSETPSSADDEPRRPLTTRRRQYTLDNNTQIDIYVESWDARDQSITLAGFYDTSPDPWILSVVGTVITDTSNDDTRRAQAGRFEGLLIKRELIPEGEDEFLRRMISANSFTQLQMSQLFNVHGQLRDRYRNRGICGTDDDDAWVLEVCRISTAPEYRRGGLGRTLVECVRDEVLTWARAEPRAVLMLLSLGTTKTELDGYKTAHPFASGPELHRASTETRLRAKRFWRSLGFRRLSERSNWFGWARPVASGRGNCSLAAHTEWESDEEEQRIDLHDDDQAEDVTERWDEWRRESDGAELASSLAERPPA